MISSLVYSAGTQAQTTWLASFADAPLVASRRRGYEVYPTQLVHALPGSCGPASVGASLRLPGFVWLAGAYIPERGGTRTGITPASLVHYRMRRSAPRWPFYALWLIAWRIAKVAGIVEYLHFYSKPVRSTPR